MENKYFTPDIKDLRLNYKCELNIDHYKNDSDWVEFTIFDPQDLSTFIKDVTQLRVPYLTKEQIEADGWKLGLNKNRYYKDNNSVDLLDNNIILICQNETLSFIGECKDINTFRYICKLINIK